MSRRRPSPLGSRQPHHDELAAFENAGFFPDDLMGAPALDLPTKLMIFGINPGLWSAAVNAPFAHPSNRFWLSLAKSGITDYRLDLSAGLSDDDEDYLARRGIALTNLVNRATAKASEVRPEELREGAVKALMLAKQHRPRVVAIVGITAFRTAFRLRNAQLGHQDVDEVNEALAKLNANQLSWPTDVSLWVVPQPSGLNAHETPETLAQKWRIVAVQAGILSETQ